MKILFVLENYFPHIGGAEIVFKNLAEGLTKLGHEIYVVTHKLKGTKKFEIINGVKVYRVCCFDSRYLFTFFAIPKVINLARNVDLIQTVTFNGAPPAWLAAKLLRKPVVIMVLEVWINKWHKLTELGPLSAFVHDCLERLIYKLNFDKYTPISNSTKKQLIDIKIKESKIETIYCGLDYAHWDPKKYDGEKIRKKLKLGNNFVYLFYGRPGISKGLEYLIRAVPLISKRIPNSRLLAIVSRDKAYEKRFNQIVGLIDKLKIRDRVILHKSVPYKDLPSYVKASNCVVIPSLSEGFGFVAVEASAMRKPIVASNTTSLPEVVSGKYVLVKPKDPGAIAKGVEMVYKNKAVKSRLKKFESKDVTKNYLKVYKEFI
jgi:glycosyltransferase involved in cell wall biosynthesis